MGVGTLKNNPVVHYFVRLLCLRLFVFLKMNEQAAGSPVHAELSLQGSLAGLFEDCGDHLGGDDSITRRRVVCL